MLGSLIFSIAVAASVNGIGYPTAAAALEALKARADVTITVQDGWTVADDKANGTLWSFTQAGHAAHPAVVRRTVVNVDGQPSIRMTTLCQGAREACDALTDEFRRVNTALQQALGAPKASTAAPWSPTASQKARVEELSKAYFADKDAQRYREAWARLGSAAQQQSSFDEWRRAAAGTAAKAGAALQREVKKVTIYRSAHSGAAGTYAAVDFTGRFANADTYCGYLVWSEQADGSFLLVREEENYIYKATEAQLTPEQRAKMLGVYRCVE
ncbi:DUF4019 domain-containing protein [Pseudoduganella sp. OTU4001]|uniref:DUF4019 domain-containing protein n=1 Tax=Pseudoduganella sp. OTU4001 TaxID=3043854 RepID=UPI00313F0169